MKKYLFIDKSIESMVELNQTTKKQQYDLLLEQCNKYFDYELPAIHPPKSTTYMGMAIANLSFIYLLTKDIKYYNEAIRWIKTVIGYEKWGHAHLVNVDLSASWIMFGLSLSYDWLKEVMDKDLRKSVEDKLLLQARIMYQYRVDTFGKGWSTSFFQNHNWINMTGLAAAGFALKDITDESEIWIKTCEENFSEVYPNLPLDGSYYEGVVYWRYGAMWLFVYAHLIKTETGKDYFKEVPFLKETFFYRLYQAVPDLGQTANFGDTHDTRSGHPNAVYYKIASEYNNGYAQNLANLVETKFLDLEAQSKVKPGILSEMWLNYLWHNPKIDPKPFTDLPLVKYFPDLGLVTHRSSWNDDATFLTFKAGAPGGKKQWDQLFELKKKGIDAYSLSHHHPDNLSFIMFSKGEYLVIDDGYNRHMKAAYHSVPLIDNKGYAKEGINDVLTHSANYLQEIKPDYKPEDFEANITSFNNDEHGMQIVSEAHKVYDPSFNMLELRRNILTTHNDYFIITDTFHSKDKHTYQFLIQAPTKYTKNEQGFEINNNQSKLSVIPLNKDLKDNLVSNTIKAVMTTQEPDNFTIQQLEALELSTIKPLENYVMANLLLVNPNTKNIAVERIENESTKGFIIKMKYQTDIFLLRKTSIHYNGIITNAESVLLTFKDDELQSYMLQKGSKLRLDDKVILNEVAVNDYKGGV
ncbi:DUF4962 domain-containing protein [Acholeplasma granularum]|uniref:DUF4962 domain-containing protein n=1 Tax=Acholeplasma granularum TaxID=264635 RepID=UPI0004AEB43B|nr:DUF4962 domain-containing protein [Acholeplasma granularum]